MPDLPTVSRLVVAAEFDTELVVLVPDRRKAYHLDPGPALVFDSCRRGDSLAELADELAPVLAGDPASTRGWISCVLAELQRHGMVAG